MKIDNQIISLDPFLTQRSPSGREFRVVGVEKDLSFASEWVDGMDKFRWIVTVKFLDDNQRVQLYFDHRDQCVKKEKLLKMKIKDDELDVLQEQNPRPNIKRP